MDNVADPTGAASFHTVEFYLSDSNLPFDKFLFTLWSQSFNQPDKLILDTPVDQSLTNDATAQLSKDTGSLKHDRFHLGWIPLQTLCSFKRMRDFLKPEPQGFGNLDNVAQTLKDNSQVLQVFKFGSSQQPQESKEQQEGAGWYVRRTTELKKQADVLERSVYVKGFPVLEQTAEEEQSDEGKSKLKEFELDLQKKIEAWAKDLGVGKVLSVRMRREDKKVNGKIIPRAGKFKVSFLEDSFCHCHGLSARLFQRRDPSLSSLQRLPASTSF